MAKIDEEMDALGDLQRLDYDGDGKLSVAEVRQFLGKHDSAMREKQMITRVLYGVTIVVFVFCSNCGSYLSCN